MRSLAALAALCIYALLALGVRAAPAGMQGVLERRIAETVEVLQGKRDAEAVFDARFLADVPPDQLKALSTSLQQQGGKLLRAEKIANGKGGDAQFELRFDRATASARLTLGAAPRYLVSGFWVGPLLPIDDSPERIAADFAALPGRSGFVVAKLGPTPAIILGHRENEQFAIGSAFKLWVLDALAEDIASGRLRWDEVVRIGPRSLPGGMTQDWPEGASVTVETLATLMISISDNTATDMLISLIGRDRIGARIRALGHSLPDKTLPLLTTAEVFALKLGPADRREAYIRADAIGRAQILASFDAAQELRAAAPSKLAEAPSGAEGIEWFASPRDIAGVLASLVKREPRVRQILAAAPNLRPEQLEQFSYAGYKGGSETGVLNLSWLLRSKSGDWFAVTASWNDAGRSLDNARLEALMPRLIRLAK